MSAYSRAADYDALAELYGKALAHAPDAATRRALERYKLAPFASDPERTLRCGRVYVMSMKPYARPGQRYPLGWEERAGRPGLHRWYDTASARSNFVREADALLRTVLRALGEPDEPRDVFNTYATPFRAVDARQLTRFGLARIAVDELHRRWLGVVQPEVVLCIGNGAAPSALATVARLLAFDLGACVREEAAPRVFVKSTTCPAPAAWERVGEPVRVVAVPHLSRVRASMVEPAVVALLGGDGLP